jgi:spermidine synthase
MTWRGRLLSRHLVPAGAAVALLILGAAALAQDSRGLIESRESLYNNIYVYRQGNYVTMAFGHNRMFYTESVYNTLDERELPVTYTQYMTASLMYPKKIDSILEIGFGGGRTAWYLHRFLPNLPITSVELDPAVVALARKYFGIKDEPNFHIVTSDGRTFLANSKARYDIILIDAYRGPFVPFHLLTKEFYQLVKNHLAEGGVVAQNVEPSTMLFDSAVKTMQAVFRHVDFYETGGNIVSIAFEGAARSSEELGRVARERQAAFRLRYALEPMLRHRRRLVADTIDPKAKLLTDDFAPVETLKAIERHNRKWN